MKAGCRISSGLAKGIEKSRGMVKKAVSDVASDLMLQPQAAVQGMQGGRDSSRDSSISEQLGGLREMLAGLQEIAGGGTTQRDVVRMGVVSIPAAFSVSPKWLKLLTGFKQKEKLIVDYFDTETLEINQTEMFISGYKANLVKDTSYKGLWKGVLR